MKCFNCSAEIQGSKFCPECGNEIQIRDIFVSRNNKKQGPFSLEQINDYLAQGRLKSTDIAWHKELDDWVSLNEISGTVIQEALTPPPLPPSPLNKETTSTQEVKELSWDELTGEKTTSTQEVKELSWDELTGGETTSSAEQYDWESVHPVGLDTEVIRPIEKSDFSLEQKKYLKRKKMRQTIGATAGGAIGGVGLIAGLFGFVYGLIICAFGVLLAIFGLICCLTLIGMIIGIPIITVSFGIIAAGFAVMGGGGAATVAGGVSSGTALHLAKKRGETDDKIHGV